MHVTVVAAAVLTVFCAHAAAAQTRNLDLDVAAPDGAKLRATYYSPGRPGPGILLLHQCNRDRKAWVSLAGALASRGVHVLALDYAISIFGAASKDDGIAVPNIRRIVDLSKNAASMMRELEVGGHGAPMFDASPALLTEIAERVGKALL